MIKKKIPDPNKIRSKMLDILYRSSAGHLGSGMSVIEMLIAMYASTKINDIKKQKIYRSRVIVSKGHCAAATYSVMNAFGLISNNLLNTYHKNNSFLAGHVSHSVPFVEHSTGALGHGLAVAVGSSFALKTKFKNKKSLSLCLCGDGELQEGSVWESVMFAAHHKLDNLVVLIDYNKISSIKNTNDVINLENLKDKFTSFNCKTITVDGHNIKKIISIIKKNTFKKKPLVIICKTIKGKNIPFAENEAIWHYRTLNDELYKKAKNHLKNLK